MDPRRCDFHTHTDFSDGTCSTREIVEKAVQVGLHAVGITDHFWPSIGARRGGRGVIEQRRREIEQLRDEHPHFMIIDGVEIDIDLDGTMSPVAGGTDQFELIIGSIHHSCDSTTWSLALSKCLRKERFHILGHWDGYLTSYRTEDAMRVIELLARDGVAIELSTRYPVERTSFLELARDHGCVFLLGSDSHLTDTVGLLKEQIQLVEALGLTLVGPDHFGIS